ncbi:hypothetical protein HLB35_16145 [Halomonas sp. TBZ9]|uniref:Uncharacterized protein n=1 Tax=Vreelandella azerica TaxID=2732867 RepID=A0A7Y3U066_9GAMM|nr:hypothetical protein [Halomonas azerica]NOG32920.1 hypothetical protein [Halomonas azerica]
MRNDSGKPAENFNWDASLTFGGVSIEFNGPWPTDKFEARRYAGGAGMNLNIDDVDKIAGGLGSVAWR